MLHVLKNPFNKDFQFSLLSSKRVFQSDIEVLYFLKNCGIYYQIKFLLPDLLVSLLLTVLVSVLLLFGREYLIQREMKRRKYTVTTVAPSTS